jgi:hypothetical protein
MSEIDLVLFEFKTIVLKVTITHFHHQDLKKYSLRPDAVESWGAKISYLIF